MKVIFLRKKAVLFYGTGIILDFNSIHFYKNGKFHREDGSSSINFNRRIKNTFYYNGEHYYTIISNKYWKKFVQNLKRQEKLGIFK